MMRGAKLPPAFERVRLLKVQPEGYADSLAFDEIIAGLGAAFAALGARVDTATNTPLFGEGLNFVFGAHLIGPGVGLPANSVIVNLEQVRSGMFAQREHYKELLKRHPVLDYSPRNVAQLKQLTGNSHVYVLSVGYMTALTRITPAPRQDVDILFYGVINERRQKIIDALMGAKLAVKTLPGIYGAERDAWIARSKLVLNVHYYEDKIHEIVRTSYLLANRKAVVSECAADTEIDDDVRSAVVAVPYENIVETCVNLVRDDERRHAVEEAGFALFARRDQALILAELLPQLSKPLPRRINLGSGKAWDAEQLNIDIDPKWNPDILGNITAASGLRQVFFSQRFGLVRLGSANFDEINATDVLEHVPDLVVFMTRCLELLCLGGAMKIGVPYDLSWGAWQDPTHVRAFNERSWLYFTDWHWYLGWLETRFKMTDLRMSLSPIGDDLKQRGVPSEEIFRTPRAVDSMHVVLVKQSLSAEERQNAITWINSPR